MLSYPTSAQNLWQVWLGGAWWTPACPWCSQAAARPPWKPMVFLGQCWALVGLSLDSYKSLLNITAFGVKLTQVQQPWIVGWTEFFRADQHWGGRYVPGTGMTSHWISVLKTANKNLAGKYSAVNTRLEFFFLWTKALLLQALTCFTMLLPSLIPRRIYINDEVLPAYTIFVISLVILQREKRCLNDICFNSSVIYLLERNQLSYSVWCCCAERNAMIINIAYIIKIDYLRGIKVSAIK